MKTERITLLGSPKFKAFLASEAKRENVSVSELVRRRCERQPSEEELAVKALADELRKAAIEARESLEAGLAEADAVLSELRLQGDKRVAA
ncbi:hypothetical protein [Chitinimonas sp. BJB300]|uniref:hypothetical protein n=1 Tax=Chitinimonas sp. BJB300 TaxID=1559339 RepID=UPI000C0D775D|nr:hypothetical protein [Chitinimonas sp. BJB300]PHV11920.1 hypothetical protein CSQ89_08335 [Chitinimonas sp. BJB300]TSJ84453.1 hypothetical protein FG002_020110 [Chitinimonas sp. BJB300]